jgi:hypothetical protein
MSGLLFTFDPTAHPAKLQSRLGSRGAPRRFYDFSAGDLGKDRFNNWCYPTIL